jgi:hypothetical protein
MNQAKAARASGTAMTVVTNSRSMTRLSGISPISPGLPWPSRPRRDASSHHVVGITYAIGRMTGGRTSTGKIAPETRYSAPAMASG